MLPDDDIGGGDRREDGLWACCRGEGGDETDRLPGPPAVALARRKVDRSPTTNGGERAPLLELLLLPKLTGCAGEPELVIGAGSRGSKAGGGGGRSIFKVFSGELYWQGVD